MNKPRFNLIFISLDTCRADHLGCYGSPEHATPHLDTFSKHCLLFSNAFTHAPSTLPSHSTLFTSTYPSVHRADISTRTPLPKSLPTIATLLQRAGYATISFNGGAQLDPAWNFSTGFDTYETGESLDNNITRACSWINENPPMPFFLFLHGYDVHKSLKKIGPRFRAQFANDDEAQKECTALNARLKKNPIATERDTENYSKLYDDNLEIVDAALGTLFDFLDKTGLSNKTIVVIFADHGEEFGERGNVALHSHTLYDELLRVPLIIKIPGITPQKIDPLVGLIDVTPTILESLQIPLPKTMQGKSLMPLITGKDTIDRTILSEFHYPAFEKISVRTRKHKLILTLHASYGDAFLKNQAFKEKTNKNTRIQRILERAKEPRTLFSFIFFFALKKLRLYDLWITTTGPFKTYEFYNLEHDPKEETNHYYNNPPPARDYVTLLESFCNANKQAQVTKTSQHMTINEDLQARLNELGYFR